ncbi:predicted protein [Lichtheimia corymbifera JMRC:FSU:9682]|uniref:Uncharacterized protein n=1 Tax=Lichtheimia corymbifera JMRC:FSU:9682 TaxID=1263082 RepID=A0A068S2W6_9FUNG|nr:predicted protein [Lichtheimia corymbifera JMRC:FSU:9682]
MKSLCYECLSLGGCGDPTHASEEVFLRLAFSCRECVARMAFVKHAACRVATWCIYLALMVHFLVALDFFLYILLLITAQRIYGI